MIERHWKSHKSASSILAGAVGGRPAANHNNARLVFTGSGFSKHNCDASVAWCRTPSRASPGWERCDWRKSICSFRRFWWRCQRQFWQQRPPLSPCTANKNEITWLATHICILFVVKFTSASNSLYWPSRSRLNRSISSWASCLACFRRSALPVGRKKLSHVLLSLCLAL